MRRRRREAAYWKANEPRRDLAGPVLSFSPFPAPLSLFLSFSSLRLLLPRFRYIIFFLLRTHIRRYGFTSSTPKHTSRKLMSHVNQARSNDRHDGAPEDSRLVIVVFNNDSSPYGATNCLPVAHNASRASRAGRSQALLVMSIRAYHTYTFVYFSFGPAVFRLICNFARRSSSRAPSFFSLRLALRYTCMLLG